MAAGESSESGTFEARMLKRKGDIELKLDLGQGRREAIMRCIEGGELKMVLQDVDLDRLAGNRLGGGYLWD